MATVYASHAELFSFPRTYDVASKNVYLILWETISVDFISPHHIVVNATCVRQ